MIGRENLCILITVGLSLIKPNITAIATKHAFHYSHLFPNIILPSIKHILPASTYCTVSLVFGWGLFYPHVLGV